jgi:membrane protein
MSITPFLLWLSLLAGRGSLPLGSLTNLAVFDGIRPFLSYIRQSAESAAKGASFIFLAVTLWSSTNFLYHLRRSGEIIYDSKRSKGGLRLRLLSAALIVLVLFAFVVLAGIFLVAESIPDTSAYKTLVNALLTALSMLVAIFLCVGLNLFLCPYKMKFYEVIPGSLLTVLWWILFSFGFSIYLRFATPERLYGRIASAFVFLLWCYFMMNGFVVGALYNAKFKTRRTHKELF